MLARLRGLQFLPQDKVVEFARLNPYELLIATEKAIGDSSLYDTHMELIAKRDAMKLREQVGTSDAQGLSLAWVLGVCYVKMSQGM